MYLIMGSLQRRGIRVLVQYAEQQEHWFRVGAAKPDPYPGSIPAHVLTLPVGYRCVFCYMSVDYFLYRNLAISLPRLYPDPNSVGLIATEFGFTGWRRGGPWPADWDASTQGGAFAIGQFVRELE